MTLMDEYRRAGIKMVPNARLNSIQNISPKSESVKNLTLSVTDISNNSVTDYGGFEQVIFAVGRECNVDDLGLENAGKFKFSDGFLACDEWQNTNVQNVYALGDVCGRCMLTPGELMLFEILQMNHVIHPVCLNSGHCGRETIIRSIIRR